MGSQRRKIPQRGEPQVENVTNVSLAQNRKDDHIRFAIEQQGSAQTHRDFDDVEFLHHALGGVNLEQVRLQTMVADIEWQHPLYINAMTGGTAAALQINSALARAAAATGTALAAGSLGVALDQPETAVSFKVLRELNPEGFVFANIGAGRSVSDALRAVELLQANALQIHINTVQETVMPEGDRDFGEWIDNLANLASALERDGVPLVVKEVGFGLSRKTLKLLSEIGVKIADVSGKGGTNFAQIEAERRSDSYHYLNSFGQSAVVSLLDAPEFPELLASGGVKSPLDAVKLLALGARAVGVAGAFLPAAATGDHEKVVEQLKWWVSRMRELYALLGAANTSQLTSTDVLLRGRVREYCQLRAIDPAGYARRSES
nr:type 2 isopentenyl-diphosphate Delta-isomerase [Canibacter oris]